MFLWFVVIILALAVSGSIYQAIATVRDKQNYPAPGQMISVGDRLLHLRVTGEVTDYPTVILEAGMGSFSSNWYWVQSELSSMTRVVSYDRAGLGWSDPAPEVFDAYQSAQDLHTALTNADIAPPYVVVGHSYGGLVVRAFTDLYADEVVGMVLADTSHPDQWAHMPASRNGRVNAATTKMTGWLARLGVVRLFDLSKPVLAGLPGQPATEMRTILNQPRSWFTGAATLAIWPERTTPLIHEAQSLGDLPLAVLGVTEQPFYSEVLTNLQDELATLSSNSTRTVVAGATHENLVAKRENALEVVTAVHQVMESAQTSQPLNDIVASNLETANQ